MSEHVIKECECKKCGYKWFPRTPVEPTICPKCKSRFWREGRQRRAPEKPEDPKTGE